MSGMGLEAGHMENIFGLETTLQWTMATGLQGILSQVCLSTILLFYLLYVFKTIETFLTTLGSTTITALISTSSSSLESIIWSPNYPDSFDGNYDQVKQNNI